MSRILSKFSFVVGGCEMIDDEMHIDNNVCDKKDKVS